MSSHETSQSQDHLPRNIAIGALAAVTLGAAGIAATNHNKAVDARRAGVEVLSTQHALLSGQAIIKSGVNLRKSPKLINGNHAFEPSDNIDYRVPKGHHLTVPMAGFVTDKDGNEFMLVRSPNASGPTDYSVDYVALSALRDSNQEDLIHVQDLDGKHDRVLSDIDVKTDTLQMETGLTYIGHGDFSQDHSGRTLHDVMVPTLHKG